MTEPQPATGPNWLEKVVTAISGIALLVIIGVLVSDGFRPNEPAVVTAVADGAGDVRGESWYVPVVVENEGDEAVRDVQVTVELIKGDETKAGRFVVDWMPGRSSRRGVAVLPREWVGQPITTSVKGFVIP